jgi:hypothetical protein
VINLNNSNVSYVPLFMSEASAVEEDVEQVVAVAGTLSRFTVRLNPEIQDVGSYIFIVRKNGATTVRCPILGAGSFCEDQMNSVVFAVGDQIAIRVEPVSAPGPRRMRWTARFTH